ncbi:hypothetical protein [Rhodopirellula sp. MGV]|uniref:hypothetical protein n=1 Tax=Rhodopirellula sp. MGV TaxID=2023130 RepID=UPI001E436DD6|nr:hypothetical protein [Rhodopirellula sp. MGV]
MNRTIVSVMTTGSNSRHHRPGIAAHFHGVFAVIAMVVCLHSCVSNSVFAQDAPPDQANTEVSKDDVLRWLEQLDAARAGDRRGAEKALIEAGPDVLRYLPESRPGFSIEASERLARVRAALQASKTEVQIKPVRIKLTDATTLEDALEAISGESGIEFDHNVDETMPVQPTGAPLSFWNALDYVLDQTNLDVNHYGGTPDTIALIPRNDARRSRVNAAGYSGVFRIEPMSIAARRVYNDAQQSGLNLSMELCWQPGMTPIGITIPVEQLTGKLDDGNSLKPQSTQRTIDISANQEIQFSEFYLPFELPTGNPTKIESLSGTIESLLPGKRHDFEVPLSQLGFKKTVDAMTVQLERVQPNGGIYEVRFTVEIDDAGDALESHRQWLFQNEVFVIDSKGDRRENLGYELYSRSESGVGMGYLFELDKPDEAKLIYRSPTSVVRDSVDFVLHDIALP